MRKDSENVCKLRANALHATKFHAQTALGTSKDSYSHRQYPIYGLGQESGPTGNEWSFISISMTKIVEETSKCWHSRNPSGDNEWCTHMSIFADDTQKIVNLSNKGENIMDVCTKLQDES